MRYGACHRLRAELPKLLKLSLRSFGEDNFDWSEEEPQVAQWKVDGDGKYHRDVPPDPVQSLCRDHQTPKSCLGEINIRRVKLSSTVVARVNPDKEWDIEEKVVLVGVDCWVRSGKHRREHSFRVVGRKVCHLGQVLDAKKHCNGRADNHERKGCAPVSVDYKHDEQHKAVHVLLEDARKPDEHDDDVLDESLQEGHPL